MKTSCVIPNINDETTQNETVTDLYADRWYVVTVVDLSMQIVTDSIRITQPDPLNISKTYSPKICPGTNNGFITLEVSGGVTPYLYSWSEGSYTQNLTDLPTGTFKVTVTDWNDCQIIDSTKIVNFATPRNPEICLVTVNHENRIGVIWEKSYNQGIVSYNIYRGASLDELYNIRTITSSAKSWTDKSPPKGQIYYRVEVVRPSSCFPTKFIADEYNSTFSNYDEETIVAVDELNSDELMIYPNPFSDQTTILFPNPSFHPYRLILTDLSGRIIKILDKITTNEIVLSRDGLPEGVYLLELKGIEIYRGKIVIE